MLCPWERSVRGPWEIENWLHWVLDVTFNEDQSRIPKDDGPDDFALRRRFALSLIQRDTSPGSIKRKRIRAAWNQHQLAPLARITTSRAVAPPTTPDRRLPVSADALAACPGSRRGKAR